MEKTEEPLLGKFAAAAPPRRLSPAALLVLLPLLGAAGFVLTVSSTIYAASRGQIAPPLVTNLATAGPRYAYVTMHGDGRHSNPVPIRGSNQVWRFDLEAPEAPPQAVVDKSSTPTPPRMLRTMAHGPGGSFFLANGFEFDSCVQEFGPCDATGKREFVREYRSPVLVHVYGLLVHQLQGERTVLYGSSQDSGYVVGFDVDAAAEHGRELWEEQVYDYYHANVTFRGLAWHDGCLFVSNMDGSAVERVCDGLLTETIPINVPVGLTMDEANGLLYICSTVAEVPGGHVSTGQGDPHIAVYDVNAKRVVREMRHPGMIHPTNVGLRGDTVVVLSQSQSQLLEFDRATGDFRRVLVQLTGKWADPEGLLLSDC